MLVAAPPGDVSPGKELGHFSKARLCKRGHAQTEDSEAVRLGEVATQQFKGLHHDSFCESTPASNGSEI